ncbi:MAG TPA: tol-pal system protein YbgF [Pseudomonadales bacterium]|nr:tol-pal system protein YbgF [Pseudomonadales bacterium]
MIRLRPTINGVLVVLASTPFLFGADNPVKVESLSNDGAREIPYQPPVDADAGAAAKASPKSGGELEYQLQVLEQEMQELRGMVEQLQHQMKQQQSTQEDRYLDLDKRIQSLQQQVSQGGTASQGASQPAGGDIEDVNKEAPVASKSAGEKAMYEKGLDMIRKRQYDNAIKQLQAVIAQYPNGDFTANAYYWMGEVYAAKPEPDYDKARQALSQVMTYFPGNNKVPDAAFKLGKVYFLMGDCKRAQDTLNKVVKDYQGKSVAKLAEDYLHNKVHCDN